MVQYFKYFHSSNDIISLFGQTVIRLTGCHMSVFCPQYQKPSLILEQEKLVRQELVKMKSSRDGDVECRPS